MAVVRLSPLRRRHLPSVQVIAGLLEPLDRAIRNLRVLIRRAAIATWRGERVPAAYLGLLSSLAEATDEIAGELQERRIPTGSRRGLSAIAEVSAVIDPSAGLSSEVMRAQIRSMVVDLLMLTGLPYEEAREFVPESMGGEEPGRPTRSCTAPEGDWRTMTTARHHLPPLWVMVLGLVAVAANLRTVMASVPPLVQTIAVDLGVSNAAMGRSTTLPVLCMGVFAPVAQRVVGAHRRGGGRRGGSRVRRGGHWRCASSGAHVVAAVCRDVPRRRGHRHGRDPAPRPGQGALPAQRSGLVTGLYMFAMMGGAGASSALAVPLSGLAGHAGRPRWPRGPCWAWSGSLAWVPGGPTGHARLPRREPSRRRSTTACPGGTLTAWLVAGVPRHPVVAVLLLARLAGPHLRRAGLGPDPRGLPAVGLHRRPAGLGPARPRADRPDPRPPAASARRAAVLGLVGQTGLWLAPTAAPWVWAVVLGLGQGAAFALAPGADGRLRRHPGGQRAAGRHGVLLQLHGGLARPRHHGGGARRDRRLHRRVDVPGPAHAGAAGAGLVCCGRGCARWH